MTMRSVPASRRLVSAFGSSLHGFHRGPQAFFPEPVDVWLAALMDAVPFYQECLVVCPSTLSADRATGLLRRTREHIPRARMLPLCRRHVSNASTIVNTSEMSLTNRVKTELPPFCSPLEDVLPHSLDLVVLAANVFGGEMLHDAPWHMSLAHRALRPHGVIAILGYDPRVRVVAPSVAQCDTNDFLNDLDREAGALAEWAPASLRRAAVACSSAGVGHADTYFPFPAVRRRWFVSEYAATPAQLAAAYRALPEYQMLAAGRREAGVTRRHGAVDPLEALHGCLASQGAQGGTLRVHVRHFVVTCSSRSANAPPRIA